jgi:hypothetical protein
VNLLAPIRTVHNLRSLPQDELAKIYAEGIAANILKPKAARPPDPPAPFEGTMSPPLTQLPAPSTTTINDLLRGPTGKALAHRSVEAD